LTGKVSFSSFDTDTQNAITSETELIIGTQTSSTSAWTGTSTKLREISVGTRISYKLPYASTSSAVTLNLTLNTELTTGAKEVYYLNTTRLSNQYAVNSIIQLIYDGSAWRVLNPYSDANTYDRTRYQQAIKAGTPAIVAGNIIVAGANNAGTYTHLKLGNAFDTSYPILYAESAISAGSTGTNNYLIYPVNITNTQSGTYTAYRAVYIKGTLSGTTFTPVSTTPLTQTVPTTDDGYYYILLGTTYSTTGMYLLGQHEIFRYYNDGFKTVSQIAAEAAVAAENAQSAADAAQNAIDTNTETIIGTQTSNTYYFTGTAEHITELTNGLTIQYLQPRSVGGSQVGATYTTISSGATTNTNGAVLNLTLADGTQTGDIPIWYQGVGRLTSHFGYGSSYRLTYFENLEVGGSYRATGWWVDAQYNSDTVDNRIVYFTGKTGAIGIWAGSLFMRDSAGTYQNICTASDGTATSASSGNGARTTATTKLANTNGFEVGSPIWYTSTSYNANTNITGTNVIFSSMGNVFDSRYAFNTTLTANNLTPYANLYLVGTVNSTDGLFYLDSTWWTQAATDTSKVYVLVGGVYDSSTSYSRITLYEDNKWLVYKDGKLQEYNKVLANNA